MKKWLMCVVVAMALATAAVVAAPAASAAPGGGWNNPNCHPSAQHPNPVVFAHGLGSNGLEDFFYLSTILTGAGYCVFTPTYGMTLLGPVAAGLDSLATTAAQLKVQIDSIRRSTGAKKVNLVGHSEGTTVGTYYMKYLGGASAVDRYVGFGTNYKGTTVYGLTALETQLGITDEIRALGCGACADFAPNSPFLRKLNAGGTPAVPGPHYTNVSTQNDEIVLPYTSGQMPPAPNVTNIILQDLCPTDLAGHLAMAIDPNIAAIILNDFGTGSATPVKCFGILGNQKKPPSLGFPLPA